MVNITLDYSIIYCLNLNLPYIKQILHTSIMSYICHLGVYHFIESFLQYFHKFLISRFDKASRNYPIDTKNCQPSDNILTFELHIFNVANIFISMDWLKPLKKITSYRLSCKTRL